MEIYPNKGLYGPHEPIGLTILCDKDILTFTVRVYSLDEQIKEIQIKRTGRRTKLMLPPVQKTFAGYGVVCEADNGDVCSTAFDVQRHLRVFRYGFLSDFSQDDANNADIHCMTKHHINAVQFYDWSYRHDSLVPKQDDYTDMMGKHNSRSVICNKIQECHECGMRAVGYGAVYAASEEFAQAHPSWRLCSEKGPLRFIQVFSIMNLRSQWQQHLIDQYRQAIEEMNFDGIHMDTYGFPKTALDAGGRVLHLEDDFPALIKNTHGALSNAILVFNNVGAWPLEQTMHTDVDAAYIEVWPPYDKYHHIKELIQRAKQAGKPVILAAYPAAFRTDEPQRALNAQLILLSAIMAHGATQLWFGEENTAITQGYYADYSRLSETQEKWLRRFDDFFVQYQELFFDDGLVDVSMSHFGWENMEYRCNVPASPDGSPNRLWLIIREGAGKKLISIVNLCGDQADEWVKGRSNPVEQSKIQLTVQIFGTVKKVFSASPDYSHGIAIHCNYEEYMGDRSKELIIKLPKFKYFSFVYIETEESI